MEKLAKCWYSESKKNQRWFNVVQCWLLALKIIFSVVQRFSLTLQHWIKTYIVLVCAGKLWMGTDRRWRPLRTQPRKVDHGRQSSAINIVTAHQKWPRSLREGCKSWRQGNDLLVVDQLNQNWTIIYLVKVNFTVKSFLFPFILIQNM